jgi:nicotinamidase-related amidase
MASTNPSHPRSSCVLLLVDVINDLEFDGGEKLVAPGLDMARRVADLAARARAADVPVIYANDNFGHWRSDFRAQVDHCIHEEVRGRAIARLLVPTPTDYFILKPKHSAFFATALEPLLRTLGAHTIVLAGIAGDSCVLFTAHDAHMRDYGIVVPDDAVVSEDPDSNRWALHHMRRMAHAETPAAADVDFVALARAAPAQRSHQGLALPR